MSENINSPYFFENNLKAFQVLVSEIFPKIAEGFSGDETLKLWNPTAMTGQQTYSLVMGADSKLRRDIYQKLEVFGTSPSTEEINKAKEGIYTGMEVQKGLPIKLLLKYFEQLPDKSWKVIDKILSKVQLEAYDILKDPAKADEFHVVLCPNIFKNYEGSESSVVDHLEKSVKKGGFVFTFTEETSLSSSANWDKQEFDGFVAYIKK